MAAQRTETVKHHRIGGVGHNEDHIPRLGVHPCAQGGHLLLAEEFLKARCHFVGGPTGVGKPLGLVGLDKLDELVNFLAGELVCSPLDVDRTYAARLKRSCKHLEFGVAQQVGQVGELKAEPGVWLIRSESVHCLLIANAAQRQLNVHIQDLFEHVLHKPLVDLDDVVDIDKAHFEVDLGEFGLTIGAQVLIPEAAGDLHVTVKSSEHSQLFVLLGGLGQGKEFARVHAGGDEVVARTLRGRFDEDRGLNLNKAIFIVVVARRLGDLVTHEQRLLHLAAAQVEIAVFKTELLVDIGVVGDFKRGNFSLGENAQVVDKNLDIAGGEVGVFALPLPHRSLCHQHKFRATGGRLVKYSPVRGIVKRKLHDAGAVAQIEESEVSEVAPLLHKSRNYHSLTHAVHPHVVAVVGSFESVHLVCHLFYLLVFKTEFPRRSLRPRDL